MFWQGRVVAHAPHHDVDSTLEEPAQFAFLGRISSPLPEQMHPPDLYRALRGAERVGMKYG